MKSDTTPGLPSRRAAFEATHWSVVFEAGHADTTSRLEALETLCRVYWDPLYAYVRRSGRSREDAEDLTQGFFTWMLERSWMARADQTKGRFRNLLLTALKGFLADQWDRSQALKRGGKVRFVSLDSEMSEDRYHLDLPERDTPEQAFERQWANTVLRNVIDRLRHEYEEAGKAAFFAEIKVSLTQFRSAVDYAGLAHRLQMSEGALRVAVHRLRQRYREALRDEVARTLADPAEVEAELRYLFQALAR